jgi:hypothetical protein
MSVEGLRCWSGLGSIEPETGWFEALTGFEPETLLISEVRPYTAAPMVSVNSGVKCNGIKRSGFGGLFPGRRGLPGTVS